MSRLGCRFPTVPSVTWQQGDISYRPSYGHLLQRLRWSGPGSARLLSPVPCHSIPSGTLGSWAVCDSRGVLTRTETLEEGGNLGGSEQ